MFNIINKEAWSSGSAHAFYIHLVIFKEWKHTIKSTYSLKYSVQVPLFDHTKNKQKL